MSKLNMKPGPVTLDVVGLELNAQDRRRIQDPLTGGVILFGRNFASRKQLTKLTGDIKKLRPDVLISIDHEGGRVQRAKQDGFTHLPAMRKLGELWSVKNTSKHAAQSAALAMAAATACGYVLGAELRACGVDFSFTPVLDLDFGRSGVIGDRSFSRDPQIVFALAKSLNDGLRMAGMANCGKHFPGHGWAEADSHVAIPVDERSLQDILNDDAKPYEWLDLSLAAVMPAHVIYPQVDSLPAGFSKIWLHSVLRQELGFEGVIFSDDLSMEGASVAGSVVKGAELALEAGCDAVLICNRPDLADQLLKDLRVSKAKQSESMSRLNRLMPQPPALDWNALQKEAQYQHAKGLLQQFQLIA
ncbi:beta-N-acetylhexosaminidase [Polynucleobacter sphagniphilus]|uniref:Beta-hexosaminidase n=1 Tax=Polynucleobacter sphagniphilus TaxID=1743169 RepID=A0AA43M8V4_9BURK|nr:beta-N-acetylhexosaminidase [Polynucleobacter sphagniphilus]MDF9787454.1 beta-N-acetylhexosaminidase [Polynucleobacter sphagniphilus]MDH6154171.1 beta-N-acetylhexosaminidase [Polynucleobacter sphagniphilus]MDH6240445.1 beta-N-acetylhexosaminidase [Polynucleobacter sphagniphilus]MDH6302142.1 beta-N-acetylhexosaminidase [Polynucleobacter sphagniphilus]MDH6420774.1 beta-N-acetylhexosaminidase [Polynucleobacter sphagniphilus]